jgi:uncharacterized protein
MQQEVHFKNLHDEELAGILHLPKESTDKCIILSHCFTCSKHHPVMKKLAKKLTYEGFTSLRFDMSGNGESQGKFEESTYTKQTEDLDSAITLMEDKGYKTIGLIGHSMGAAISMIIAAKDRRINSVCVLGSQANTERIAQYLSQEQIDEVYKKGETEITIFHRKFTIKREFLEDSKHQHLDKFVSRIKQPFCIIHGDKDEIVACSNAKKLHSFSKGSKVHIIKNADHFFTKHFEDVEKIVVDWFNKTI